MRRRLTRPVLGLGAPNPKSRSVGYELAACNELENLLNYYAIAYFQRSMFALNALSALAFSSNRLLAFLRVFDELGKASDFSRKAMSMSKLTAGHDFRHWSLLA